MKVLITNAFLHCYGGTQVVVRDLAMELSRQGHKPSVFSPKLGVVADEIKSHGIEVVDRLDRLSSAPDIIHGHHPAAIEAMLYFPSTPGIYVSHGAGFLGMPVCFPRTLRYVAVDERCKKVIESVPGIPTDRIRVIWNAVDLSRFQQRDPLPIKPRRALAFSNNASPSTYLPALRKACRQAGLELHAVGLQSGNPSTEPEQVLPGYDIVFAKARCALEALAVGNAVVLCDAVGLGGMVTSRNFDDLRRKNFGMDALVRPLDPELIREEIARYDAQDASLVCRRAREEAGLARTTQQWVQLYTDVIDEFRNSPRDVDDELRAVSRYVAEWNYGKRVDWELEQLEKLRSVPVIGKLLLYFARRIWRQWANRAGPFG